MLALIFLAPVISAWVAWTFMGTHGATATTNAGRLIVPARPLVADGLLDAAGAPLDGKLLRGRWTYVLFATAGCDARCERQIYITGQLRKGLNKDMSRVRRLLVLSRPAAVPAQGQDLQVATVGGGGFLRQFREAGQPVDGASFFLVDPLGNLMMAYDLEVPFKGLFKDIRKLLKVSQVG